MSCRACSLALCLALLLPGANADAAVAVGAQVRLRAPAVAGVAIRGAVVAVGADSLVLKRRKSPWHVIRQAVALAAIEKLEVLDAATGDWHKIDEIAGQPVRPLQAEIAASRHQGTFFWYSTGIGVVSSDRPVIAGALSLQQGLRLLSLRATYAWDPEFPLWLPPPEEAIEASLLYGRVYKGRQRLLSVAVGLGIADIKQVRRGELLYTTEGGLFSPRGRDIYAYRQTKHRVAAFPTFEIQFTSQMKHCGVGLYVYGHWNSVEPQVGALLALQVGSL